MAGTCHPEYRLVVETYLRHQGIAVDTVPAREGVLDLDALDERLGSDVAGLLVQHPNFFGHLEPVRRAAEAVHAAGGLFVVSVDPISLGLLAPQAPTAPTSPWARGSRSEPPLLWRALPGVSRGQGGARPPDPRAHRR